MQDEWDARKNDLRENLRLAYRLDETPIPDRLMDLARKLDEKLDQHSASSEPSLQRGNPAPPSE